MEGNNHLVSEYNWESIWKGVVPGSIGVSIAFANMTSNWKWVIAAACIAAAYGITSFSSRKKADLFTSMALVLVAALLMHFLSKSGIL